MACEFSFGGEREELLNLHGDMLNFFTCAVECGRNPKFRHPSEPDKVVYEFLRYEHVPMLKRAAMDVCRKAKKNVKDRKGKLSFENDEEMERYQRDVLIADGFFREFEIALNSIPKNCQAHMLRGLARYMRLADYGKDHEVDEEYMLGFAEYLMNVLCWVCHNSTRVYRTFDTWVFTYMNNPGIFRKEFINLPDYSKTERKALHNAGMSARTE